jgi:hypothetical protein
MTVSHSTTETDAESADILVSLVCLAILRDHRPMWVTAPVAERADESGISRWRVSRIKAAVQGRIVELIRGASRPGRRPFRCGA